MERPKISDYTKDLLASYDQLSDFSCNQDKFIDQSKKEHEKNIKYLYSVLKERRNICDKLEKQLEIESNLHEKYRQKTNDLIDENKKLQKHINRIKQ